MILRRWCLVGIAILVTLLACACFRSTQELRFNEDGSGTMNYVQTFGPSVMSEGLGEDETPEEICSEFPSLLRAPNSGLRIIRVESHSDADGSCTVTFAAEFDSPQDVRGSDVEFTGTDDGWRIVVPIADFVSDMDELYDFSSVSSEDVYTRLAVRIPGRPSADHNAKRIEDGQFVWEATGADLQNLPSELRASSSAAGSNYTWIVLVVVGIVLALGAAHVVQQRRTDELNIEEAPQ